MHSFPNIRIVLVNTTHPGNIGAAARAMKTMCLDRLYLVQPQHYPSAEATARASGADDVLAAARVCTTLDEALSGCGLVAGASARLRTLAWPQLDPRECAQRIVKESRQSRVALVFGREHSGLSNEELDRCQYLVHIPGNPAYSSLNLAAAVQVMAYEIMMAAIAANVVQQTPDEAECEYATAEELERFYAHLERVLTEIDFLDPDNPRHLMRRLRRLFGRTRLDQNEVNILRGILSAVQARRQRTAPLP